MSVYIVCAPMHIVCVRCVCVRKRLDAIVGNGLFFLVWARGGGEIDVWSSIGLRDHLHGLKERERMSRADSITTNNTVLLSRAERFLVEGGVRAYCPVCVCT